MYKPVFHFLGLLMIVLLSTASMCNKEDAITPEITSLIGEWEIQSFNYHITEQDGSEADNITPLKQNGVVIIWEFFSDGRLVITQDGNSLDHRWELEVTQLYDTEILEGTLKITGGNSQAVAASFGMQELVYGIGTWDYTHPYTHARTLGMNLFVDVTSIGPYRENILDYVFHKL